MTTLYATLYANMCSTMVVSVKPWELEHLRRSVVMLPPGHSAGAVTKTQAEELLAEIDRSQGDLARYQHAIDELRRVLAVLELDQDCGEHGD